MGKEVSITPRTSEIEATLRAMADRVLLALYQRQSFRWSGGQWQSKSVAAPDRLLRLLERCKLIRSSGGGWRLTPIGESLCRSQAVSSRRNRLLVERQLPEEGPVTPIKGAGRSVTVNLAESPLGWLMVRGMISERQFVAGEMLRSDWTRAGLSPQVTMRWDDSPRASSASGGGRPDLTLAQIAAKNRFNAAVAHVGTDLSDILWRVVCDGEGLIAAEAALGWPKRAGKLVLRIALDRLVDFYAVA